MKSQEPYRFEGQQFGELIDKPTAVFDTKLSRFGQLCCTYASTKDSLGLNIKLKDRVGVDQSRPQCRVSYKCYGAYRHTSLTLMESFDHLKVNQNRNLLLNNTQMQ